MTEDELSLEEIKLAKRIFEGEEEGRSGCVHCAGIHDTVRGLKPDRQPCPRVQRATWHQDGTLISVDYWAEGEWSTEGITFPSDVYSIEDIED